MERRKDFSHLIYNYDNSSVHIDFTQTSHQDLGYPRSVGDSKLDISVQDLRKRVIDINAYQILILGKSLPIITQCHSSFISEFALLFYGKLAFCFILKKQIQNKSLSNPHFGLFKAVAVPWADISLNCLLDSQLLQEVAVQIRKQTSKKNKQKRHENMSVHCKMSSSISLLLHIF